MSNDFKDKGNDHFVKVAVGIAGLRILIDNGEPLMLRRGEFRKIKWSENPLTVYSVADMDRISQKRRSEIMSRIRGKDTSPELAVRSLLHSLGYRYRLHSKKLPGCPDLVFSSRKKVIFVHGCFWHGHKGCKKGKLPKSRLEYWEPKIKANQKRDGLNLRKLKAEGWDVLTVWQCQLKSIESIKKRIVSFLERLKAYE